MLDIWYVDEWDRAADEPARSAVKLDSAESNLTAFRKAMAWERAAFERYGPGTVVVLDEAGCLVEPFRRNGTAG